METTENEHRKFELNALRYRQVVQFHEQFHEPMNALSVLCAQLTYDLFAIAKFLFTEIWRYNDFQNGGIVLPLYETTHEVTVAGRSCMSNFLSI